MLETIPADKGTYLLVFQSDRTVTVNVGRQGKLDLVKGYYVYIGSAFGPGGLRARLKHHAGISQKPHWHLDYIRPELSLKQIWYSVDPVRHEHVWAESLYYTLKLQVPMAGLGSSDCKCKSHFFYTKTKLQNAAIQTAITNQDLTSLERIHIDEQSVG